MAESTVDWFGVREKYCSLADKPWLISQIRPSEQALVPDLKNSTIDGVAGTKLEVCLH